jgi:hypothetical protein
MIPTHEAIDRRNEKLFNKLSDLIDKRILDLDEEKTEFHFELLSNTPNAVVNMIIDDYGKNGWSIRQASTGKLNSPIARHLHFELGKSNDIESQITQWLAYHSLLLKISTENSDTETSSLNFSNKFTIKNPEDKEISKILDFENESCMIALKSLQKNTIYTYLPTIKMAMTDAFKQFKLPTKIFISTVMFNKIFREEIIFDKEFFDEATQRDVLMTGLYGHLWNMDIHVFDPKIENENDIYIFSYENMLIANRKIVVNGGNVNNVNAEPDNVEYYLEICEPANFAHIHVYR